MLSWQILRRLPQPLPPWCRKSRGKIEWLVGHQNGGKRLISPPTYSKIDVEQLLFTKVHHKVSKNRLKVGGGVALTMKFGETEVLDLFWLIFIFLPMYFPLRDPTGLQWNLGKGLFVFLLIHISDLCAIASHFSTQGAWYSQCFMKLPVRFVWNEWCRSKSPKIRSHGSLCVQSCAFISRESLS